MALPKESEEDVSPEAKARWMREDLEMFLEYVIRRKRASVKVKSAGEQSVK